MPLVVAVIVTWPPLLRLITILEPALTGSEVVAVILISLPTPYKPLAVVDVMLMIVGLMVSTGTLSTLLAVKGLPASSRAASNPTLKFSLPSKLTVGVNVAE